jgi:pimeloyl-ACP methyl ester carboxylesterase
MWKGAYVWNDMETARQEIQHYAESIRRKYAVHPDQVVLGGHSMGGEVAIWLALTGAVEATGFIVIGPGGPLTDEPDSWGPVIEQARGRSLRGYVIVGEQDDLIAREEILALVDRLNEAGLSTEVEIIPGARHDFVSEYEAPLLRGLEYLTEE